jgi:glucosylceramidase
VAATTSATSFPAWNAAEPGPTGEITAWITAGQKRYQRSVPLRWEPAAPQTDSGTIHLNPELRCQQILGFGVAFTDAACYMVHQLPESARNELLRELFHPSEMGLNVCRTCIGASDYSTELYSFDEGEPDPELKRFSIDRDKAYLLPALRAARAFNPDLMLFSSPWSPPGWMKANGSMLGGSMRKKYFASYAQYFVKFLQAYAAEGVSIQAVTSQNEVDTDQDGRMPACLWGQEYEVEFIRQHLGPALEAAGLPTRIWLLDHNYNLWGRVICSLDDPGVRKYCGAVAWHGYVGSPDMICRVHEAHPNVAMHWTEGGPDYTSPGYATEWASWGQTCVDALRNWCESVTAWNLALDERGRPNIGPFPCGGFVTIDSRTGAITRSGQYWAFAHFSRSIRRGARRFTSSSNLKDISHVACQNPDGEKVLVLANPGPQRTVWLRSGNTAAKVALEGDSMMTLVWK